MQVWPQQRTVSRVSAKKTRGRGDNFTLEDRVVQRDMMPTEAPRPSVTARLAEDRDVIELRVAPAWAGEVDGEILQSVEDIVEANDCRHGVVTRP